MAVAANELLKKQTGQDIMACGCYIAFSASLSSAIKIQGCCCK
jgi:hypothetical protein